MKALSPESRIALLAYFGVATTAVGIMEIMRNRALEFHEYFYSLIPSLTKSLIESANLPLIAAVALISYFIVTKEKKWKKNWSKVVANTLAMFSIIVMAMVYCFSIVGPLTGLNIGPSPVEQVGSGNPDKPDPRP